MVPLENEQLLSLSEAARRLPPGRLGKPTHVRTLLRWGLKGLRGVHLDLARLGGRWVTSVEALERFSARLTAAQSVPVAVAPTSGRHAAVELAEAELDKLGL
jgi:hypothetical protein